MAIAITKIKDWYTDESRWNKGAYYIDIFYNEYDLVPDNRELKSCCLIGAISMCYAIMARREILDKVNKYINNNRPKTLTIVDWNDSEYTTFNDIKKLVNELDI